MKYVAFIGSRDLSQFSGEQIGLYKSAVRAAVQHGYAVVTGAAPGADQLAAETALQAGGKVLLVLPWALYEWEWVERVSRPFDEEVRVEVYDPSVPAHAVWAESVTEYHPAAAGLKQGARALHARNYGIVARSVGVVALAGYAKGGGGTGQGMRIAAGRGIPCWDLRDAAACESLRKKMGL